MKLIPGVTILLFILAIWPGYADVDTGGNSGGMLERQRVIERAAAVSTNRFPNAEEVLVSGMTRLTYEPDGTYEQWHEAYLKILTEEARRKHLTLSSYYTIPYQRGPEDCSIPLVEIIHSDGSVTLIDVALQSKTMINPSSMNQNIYNPNDKIITVNVSGLEIGDVLHYVMYDRIVHPRMAGTFSDYFVLESTRPVVHEVIEITGPKALPLHSIALKDEVEGTVSHTTEEREDRIIYGWEVNDVPRMFPEPNMPSLHTVVQRLLVSTNPDWETVSRWYWDISVPHFDSSSEMESKVEELTASLDDPRKKIEALFNFVSQEIRYMGIIAESEAPGYEPHDVKDTFDARHGVCRDKAALLAVMLRSAGLDAFPTLIQNGPRKDQEVPQPYFNHAIVAVKHQDEYILMDPTDETTKELLPSYLDDRSFLVAKPDGETLKTSVIEPAEKNLVKIKTTGHVDSEGRLTAETVMEFGGINDNAYRGYFARLKREERRRLFEGRVRGSMPGARITDVMISPEDMLDTTTGLTVRITYEADDILVRGNDIAMLPLPALGTGIGMVNFILGKTGLNERKYPLETGYACGVKEHITLTLDSTLNTPVAIPTSEPVNTDAISWSMSLSQQDDKLDAVGDFRLHVTEFSPDQYMLLKDTLKTIEKALRKMPAYAYVNESQALGQENDILVESFTMDCEVVDESEWIERRTVRKKILTYAGKKANSELIIRYNPAWDDLELNRAIVTDQDGKVTEISEGEINIMDAGWVGSAARYPPQKTFVASLPAVSIGSTLEYTFTRTRRDRPFFALRESFAGFDAIAKKSVSIKLPPGMDVAVHRNGLEGHVSESRVVDESNHIIYTWDAQDVAPIKSEDSLPPVWDFTPTVTLSSGEWDTYARRINKRLKRAGSRQQMARAEARKLKRDNNDPWKQLEAIRDFVALRVRPAGPSLTALPLSSITPADRTLADGYGNTTDRAVLLYAMLRAAGFAPEFVLVSGRPSIERFRKPLFEAPFWAVFSEVVVRVADRKLDLPDDRFVYLGDTDQYAAIGASGHGGRWGLTLAKGAIEPILPVRDNHSWSEYDMTVLASGDTRLTVRRLLFGTAFGAENKLYSLMRPEERVRHYHELVGAVSQSAVAVSDLETDFDVYPGRIEFSVDISEYAVRDDDLLYFTLPTAKATLFSLRSDERTNPVYFDQRVSQQTKVQAQTPPDFEIVALPEDIHRSGLAATRIGFEIRTENAGSEEGSNLFAETEVQRRPSIVEPTDYPKLLQWQRDLAHRRARTVVLRRRGD
jgi:transglutaminase-like putative cysteine protease